MKRHLILVEVHTSQNVSTFSLADDIAFTMGLKSGVAGGYIGEPDEHAFYGASRIVTHTVAELPQ